MTDNYSVMWKLAGFGILGGYFLSLSLINYSISTVSPLNNKPIYRNLASSTNCEHCTSRSNKYKDKLSPSISMEIYYDNQELTKKMNEALANGTENLELFLLNSKNSFSAKNYLLMQKNLKQYILSSAESLNFDSTLKLLELVSRVGVNINHPTSDGSPGVLCTLIDRVRDSLEDRCAEFPVFASSNKEVSQKLNGQYKLLDHLGKDYWSKDAFCNQLPLDKYAETQLTKNELEKTLFCRSNLDHIAFLQLIQNKLDLHRLEEKNNRLTSKTKPSPVALSESVLSEGRPVIVNGVRYMFVEEKEHNDCGKKFNLSHFLKEIADAGSPRKTMVFSYSHGSKNESPCTSISTFHYQGSIQDRSNPKKPIELKPKTQ